MARAIAFALLAFAIGCSSKPDPGVKAQALLTEHEHGRTVWISHPSTMFFQLLNDGTVREIPDPIMEGPERWENVAEMRKVFTACEAPLLPPTGGAAKLWQQSPELWEPLGCVKSQAWYDVTVSGDGAVLTIGDFPKGKGRADRFDLAIAAGRWRNVDVHRHPISYVPGILMGKEVEVSK